MKTKKLAYGAVVLFGLVLSGCGGGSGDDATSPDNGEDLVTVTGQLSSVAPPINSNAPRPARRTASKEIMDWSGATLTVTNVKGERVVTTEALSDGSFEIGLAPNEHFFIRVTIGNLVLNYYYPPSPTSKFIDINPESTAVFLLLVEFTGVQLGTPGVDVSQEVDQIGVTLVGDDDDAIALMADSIEGNIDAGFDPDATVPNLGGADPEIIDTATLISNAKDAGKETFVVRIEVSDGGMVDKLRNNIVVEGNSFEFSATPDECFFLSTVISETVQPDTGSIDDPVPMVFAYRAVIADSVVEVKFSRLDHFIDASAGDGGEISPAGFELMAECGIAKTFTITANEGYVIEDVVVNGDSVGATSTYAYIASGDAEYEEFGSIEATFALEVSANDGDIGWISSPIEQLIDASISWHLRGTVPSSAVGTETRWNIESPDIVLLDSLVLEAPGFQYEPEISNKLLAAKTTSAITITDTPAGPVDITAVLQCVTEGVDTMIATVTDVNDAVLLSAEVNVNCVRSPVSAACVNASTGLEKAYECNNDLVGSLAIEDIFEPEIVDVPIGGVGRTIPGGITLFLPGVWSGQIPRESDFSTNGWDGSIAPPLDPEPAIFGLDANHQYLFIQYESGVDMVDLSTPNAEPVYSELLDYPGRVQASEFMNPGDFTKSHDYVVMPVHSSTGDYLIGCGTDVVRHDFDPDANGGAGAFSLTAARISDGFELCRDVWTDVNLDGVAPGYAYTSKTISNSQKTTKWVVDGLSEATLDGDWIANGVDDNNRIMGGVGGFFGEYALLASRGINELGLWSGLTGIAPEDSVERVSNAAFFKDVRCVESLCIATSADTITTLSWPNRMVAPSVIESSALFSGKLLASNMLVAANGNIYLPAMSSNQVEIGRVTSEGEFGGTVKINISSVCSDPEGAYILDMNHLGIMCRSDNEFKVLAFLPAL